MFYNKLYHWLLAWVCHFPCFAVFLARVLASAAVAFRKIKVPVE